MDSFHIYTIHPLAQNLSTNVITSDLDLKCPWPCFITFQMFNIFHFRQARQTSAAVRGPLLLEEGIHGKCDDFNDLFWDLTLKCP